MQQWIDDFNKEYPDIQVIIESRGTSDPAQYDILIEAYDPDNTITKNRAYAYVARYAVLPVANSLSEFAKIYGEKGLDNDLINQIYFNDIFSSNENKIKVPYTGLYPSAKSRSSYDFYPVFRL
ncbi:MAG: hypothetical protein U5K79_16130 [Cyclobacteriaceae bacterium]|nr:hypothetical protein [Cyclobacteriaceae bacterium]